MQAQTCAASSVEAYLEQTIGEAGIDFTVIIDSVFTNSNFNANTTFNIPDATLMVKYSEQMRQVRNAYFETHEQEDDTYYLFVVNALQDTVNNNSVDGYMVRGKSVGFISASAGLHTIAHELGHGIGALEHSWKNNGPEEGSSTNLMDYSSNTNLIANQWEELRYSRGSSFWDEEEDALKVYGNVAYYFWEQSTNNIIDNNTYDKPFRVNMEMEFIYHTLNNSCMPLKMVELMFKQVAIKDYGNGGTWLMNSAYWNELMNHAVRLKFINSSFNCLNPAVKLERTKQYSLKTLVVYKEGNDFYTRAEGPVIYFKITHDGKKSVLKYSDSVNLSKFGTKMKADKHYIVKVYYNDQNTIDHYEIFDYENNNVTDKIINQYSRKPERFLVFSNGYRGPDQNWDVTDGLITSTDRYHYWAKIDDEFKKRLKPKSMYYIDGSDKIGTSNHENMAKFAGSAKEIAEEKCQQVSALCNGVVISSSYLSESLEPADPYKLLNDIPNVAGFETRKYKGTLAGKTFLVATASGPTHPRDTIDIVCHSMGYAYAVGFINAIKDKVVIGRVYILAPENACSGGLDDWSICQEVWQYGSNNNPNDPQRDPFYLQDGVAPQCAVKGLVPLPQGLVGGRAYIPQDITIPNGSLGQFDGRHSIGNYMWIFNLLSNEDGYVKKR